VTFLLSAIAKKMKVRSAMPVLPLLEPKLRVVKTACPHDCPDTCSMLAHVQTQGDGSQRLVSVAGNPENPYTRGNLCRKVAHYEERVYSPDRLLYPLRRVGPKGAGQFTRITWEEAIAEIVGRWKHILAEDGPEAIQPYSYAGTMGVVNMSACDGRLWNRMGAGQLLRTICSSAAGVGYSYVYGASGGIDPESFAQSKFIIAWGTNLSSTNVHLMPFIREAQAKGATFVVIDPYKTRTANAADWFVQPRPGSDAALALGMANIIFTENLHDEAFLEANTVGWRAFRDRCAAYPPERVAQITGLDVEEIVRLARAYAGSSAPAIRLGFGLSRTGNGGGMIRAISTLPAVIGAWGKPGSGLLLSTSAHFPLNWQAVKRPDLKPAPGEPSCARYGRNAPRAVNMNEIGRALLELNDPPIRALYVYNVNPAGVAPDSNRVLAGLSREDLFTVVHEQMMTDTARYADIVLPATSQMECLDLMRAYGHLYVNLCQPAIPPLGESRANIDVLNTLAHAMGYQDDAFEETAEDIIRAALRSESPLLDGITYEHLQEHGYARLNTPTYPYVPYTEAKEEAKGDWQKEDGVAIQNPKSKIQNPLWNTASGKIELFSEKARRDGYDPLPHYEPSPESVEADPELGREFPVNLLTPAAHHFLNTTFANLPSLQKGEKEPRIWVNPHDAQERGISDGEWLRVWNRRGAVKLKAVVSDNVKPGVAWSPSLWWQRDSPDNRNVNALTSDRLTDMGGGSTFHTNLVQFAGWQE
jgi:anaerobic selenocysteine-containing dehydrogenase